MEISCIWVSQRNLKRFHQISGLVKSIEKEKLIPPILISLCEDGEYQLIDGHHRLVSYWATGRRYLSLHEYEITLSDLKRPRCGKVSDLFEKRELS